MIDPDTFTGLSVIVSLAILLSLWGAAHSGPISDEEDDQP